MALIKFINRENKTLDGTRRTLDYIMQEEKTSDALLFGLNIRTETAYKEMETVKHVFSKTTGRQHIHFTQNFDLQDQDVKVINEVGRKFLEHKLFKNFQVVMATHTDREHLHNHFVLNTVNIATGKKWQLSNEELEQLKDYSEELCELYNLHLLQDGKYRTSKEKKRGLNTKQKAMYEKVLEAKRIARNHYEFKSLLNEKGCNVLWKFEEESEEKRLFQALINQCKYYAYNEEEFSQSLEKYGIGLEWQVVYKGLATDEVESEEVFATKAEMDEALLSRGIELHKIVYEDSIKFFYEGKTYKPEHFIKNLRFEGKILREQFEVNYVRNKKRQLKEKDEVRPMKDSDAYKLLASSIKAAKQSSFDKEHFIANLKELGVSTEWSEKRKHICFSPDGNEDFVVRSRRLFPPAAYTKEALMETFEFNKKMREIIDTLGKDTWLNLVEEAKSGEVEGFRYGEEVNQLFLSHLFKQGEKETKEIKKKLEKGETVSDLIIKDDHYYIKKECYFTKDNIERFLESEDGLIQLPTLQEILEDIKKEKILFLDEDGGHFLNLSLSKKGFSAAALNQSFLYNQFEYKRDVSYQVIGHALFSSESFVDMAEKLKMCGIKMTVDADIRKNDSNRVLIKGFKEPFKRKKSVLFELEDGFCFEGTVLSKLLDKEKMTEVFERNQKRAVEEKWLTFLRFWKSLDRKEQKQQASKASKKGYPAWGKIEGEEMKHFIAEWKKGKGIER